MSMKKICTAVSLACATGAALAQTPALPHVNGLLVLPNTRVVMAKQPVALKGQQDTNMRAFMDPVTGQIGVGEVTQSEAAELSLVGRRESRKSTTGAVNIRTSADGSITGVRLDALTDDADIMPYSMARRLPSGEIQTTCVQGSKAAKQYMNAAARLEAKHAR
jgi:hypothetical protein